VRLRLRFWLRLPNLGWFPPSRSEGETIPLTEMEIAMTPTIEHPTHQMNFAIVTTNGRKYAFSYSTCVAVTNADGRWVVRENDWGPTTGKHLNWLDDGNKTLRLPGGVFEEVLLKLAA